MKINAFPSFLVLLLFSFNTIAQSISLSALSPVDLDSNSSILKSTESSENHTTLLTAMRAAELESILSYDGPFTVFAPSNLAFEKLSGTTVDELLHPENKKELLALMTYHIVAGNFSTSKILKAMCRGEGEATFITVNGEELKATMEGVDIILSDKFGNRAKITSADSNQCNGVIHEIDAVIRPSKP
jgi:uncharacterized surface protein with fasciclin (FAS1) repeats